LYVQERGENVSARRDSADADVHSRFAVDALPPQAFSGNDIIAGDEIILEEFQLI
jgi:hypothetical protein